MSGTAFLGLDAAWWQAIGTIAGAVVGLVAAVGTIVTVILSIAFAVASRNDAIDARAQERIAKNYSSTIEMQLRKEQAEEAARREAVRLAEQQATRLILRREWLDSVGQDKDFKWSVDNDSTEILHNVVVSFFQPIASAHVPEGWHELYKVDKLLPDVLLERRAAAFRTTSNALRPDLKVEFSDHAGNRWVHDTDESLTLLNPRDIRVWRP